MYKFAKRVILSLQRPLGRALCVGHVGKMMRCIQYEHSKIVIAVFVLRRCTLMCFKYVLNILLRNTLHRCALLYTCVCNGHFHNHISMKA